MVSETARRRAADPPARREDEVVEEPRVWVLTARRAGDRNQMLNLVRALGWPFEEKRLHFNLLSSLPNLVLGDAKASIGRRSSALAPPWPDIVIASGRRSVPVARWIRRRSGGRARLVHVGRPWARLASFDLVITTPQYALPERDNVLVNALTLNRVDPLRLREAAALWEPRLAHLPAPRIAVLLGGDARPYRLTAEEARRLAREVSALAARAGGSLLVSASGRTPAAARDAFLAALTDDLPRHSWTGEGENPYAGYLALADRFMVTGDSASMLSEACCRQKPVTILPLPERPDLRLRLGRGLRALAERARPGGALARAYRALVDLGLVASTRDMGRFHATLIERGLASWPGEAATEARPAAGRDALERAVERMERLTGIRARPDPGRRA